jgi:3-mercaptopyruvate sulfurtransferase SseA
MRWREDGSGPDLFERGHIPGSVFLDWSTDLVDADHPIAFTLAPPDELRSLFAEVGVGPRTWVITYCGVAIRRYPHTACASRRMPG